MKSVLPLPVVHSYTLSHDRITLISPLAQPVQEPLCGRAQPSELLAGGSAFSPFSLARWHGETQSSGSVSILDRINSKSACQTV